MIGMNEEEKRKTKLCCLSELYKLCPLGKKKPGFALAYDSDNYHGWLKLETRKRKGY